MKRKTEWISFRLSEEEKRKIKKMAIKENKHTGEFIRVHLMAHPYYECPSFISCSCNKCPLDPNADDKIALPGEEKCKAHKPTRRRIGEKYQSVLPRKGLTLREYSGKMNWDRKSHEEKKKIVERGTKALKSLKTT